MKNFLIGAASVAFCYGANAADLMPYANTVTANMISGIQHTIANRALGGMHGAKRSTQSIRTVRPSPDRYGTMLYYGEFGDDTGILPMLGRAGGDEELTPVRMGVDFSHSNEDVKFDNLNDMKSKINVARISVSPQMNDAELEIFAGYAGHNSHNTSLDIDGDGAFFGVASRTSIDGFGLGVVINGGVMANTATSAGISRDFENIWAAATVGAGYDLELLPAVYLRSGVTAGYMWISAQNYIAQNGDNVDVKSVGMFELSPSMKIDFKLQDNWHFGARGAYVMNFMGGGETSVAYVQWPDLDTRDYIEYGIDFGRRTDRLDLSFNLGRHDIGRVGWYGGAHISYLF